MKNTPYVKKLNEIGKCTNEITKESPFINAAPSNRGSSKKLYVVLVNPITGAFMGRMRAHGNNRATSSSRRDVNSRANQRF